MGMILNHCAKQQKWIQHCKSTITQLGKMIKEVSTGLGAQSMRFTVSQLPATPRAVLGLHIREMNTQKVPWEKAVAVTVACVLNPAPPSSRAVGSLLK